MGRRIEKIPAKLADILKARAIPFCDVVPELVRGKSFADHYRSPTNEQRPSCNQAAGGVIEREAVVYSVGRTYVHHTGKREAGEHQPVVVHVGGFWQAGRPGGVDVERAIFDGQTRALRLRQIIPGEGFDPAADA